ncbi:MAG TPA: response regulator transcription factor [Candidatus Brocadiia bacterium]|nr:response regulator transcription factor [Candidatus Brocadiia bacterium]
MAARILLVDDHEIFLEGLKSMLATVENVEVAGGAADGAAAVRMAAELKPDVVVMDMALPDMSGVEAARKILEAQPEIKIIALSAHSDKRFVVEMFRAGGSAYLLKRCAFEDLAKAIEAVMAGQKFLSPSIAGIVVGDYLRQLSLAEDSKLSGLTAREREVFQLLVNGQGAKQIARQLGVSERTAAAHRMQIMTKLGLENTVDLIKFAVREGLTGV